VPGKVSTIQAAPINEFSAHLTWDVPPNNGHPIDGYIIRARRPDQDSFVRLPAEDVIIEDTNDGAVVIGLQVNQIYMFTVSAVNSLGTGIESEPSVFIQLPEAEALVPTMSLAKGLSLVANSSHSLFLVSRSSCNQMGWWTSRTANVCGSSKPFGKCPALALDYTAAASFCAAAGTRLCTARELQSGSLIGFVCDNVDEADQGSSMRPTVHQVPESGAPRPVRHQMAREFTRWQTAWTVFTLLNVS
jgi:hypothetical protein